MGKTFYLVIIGQNQVWLFTLTLVNNLSIRSGNVRLNGRLSVGLSGGSRERSFNSAPEPYQAVGNDGKKIVYLSH